MAASGQLAQQVVEFVAKGLESVQGAMKTIKQGLADVDKMAGAVATGLKAVSAATLGWVAAGLVGTTQGNLIALQFQLISREIASVFIPTINRLISALQSVLQWFRELNGDQQRVIQRFLEAAVVMATMLVVLPRVGAALATLGTAARFAAALVTEGFTEAAIAVGAASGGIVPLIGIIVTALAGIAVGTETGRSGLAALFGSFGPLMEAMSRLGEIIGEKLGPMMEMLGTLFTDGLGAAMNIVIGLFDSFAPLLIEIAAFIGNVVQSIGPLLGALAKIGLVISFGPLLLLAKILDMLLTPILAVANALMEAFTPFGQLIGQVVGALLPLGKLIWDLLILPFRILGAVLSAVFGGADLNTFTNALRSVAEWLGNVIRAISQGVAGAINFVVDVVATAIERLAYLMSQIPVIGERVGNEMRRIARDIRAIQVNMNAATQPGNRPRQNVSQAGGGPEQADALFRRLQTTSLRTERDPAEITAEETRRIREIIERMGLAPPSWLTPTPAVGP